MKIDACSQLSLVDSKKGGKEEIKKKKKRRKGEGV